MLSQYQANPRVGHLETLYHVFAYHKCHLDMGHGATRKQGKLFLRLLMLTMREVLKPGGPIWDHDLFAECASFWYGSIKGQGTVEAARFGSEFVALRICNEFIVALQLQFIMLSVPIDGSDNVFCELF